jgi:superfamily II DNA helicase RecQ
MDSKMLTTSRGEPTRTKRKFMQIKLFTIPIGDSGNALNEMNSFLRGNKILEVQNQLISNESGAYWCFCVKYIESILFSRPDSKTKVDYGTVLDEATFLKFSKLREIRKQVAANEAIPAFAIFTDEELASLAKLPEITPQTMLSIKGIGEKKVERYAKYFITKPEQNEKSGTPDTINS